MTIVLKSLTSATSIEVTWSEAATDFMSRHGVKPEKVQPNDGEAQLVFRVENPCAVLGDLEKANIPVKIL